MDWIPLYRSLAGHPKTKHLARLTTTPIPAILGHLSLLWSWAVDYAPDGDLSRFEPAEIADACMWPEDDAEAFCAALRTCGFIDPDGRLHNWSEYTGAFMAKRAANAERMRRARAGNEERASTVRERAAHVQPDDERRAGLEGKEGTGVEDTEPNPLARDEPERFAEFYEHYPRKVGRRRAASAFRSALRRVSADVLIDSVRRYAGDPNQPDDRSKIPHATTWLNRDGWEDEPLPKRNGLALVTKPSPHRLDQHVARIMGGGG